MTLALQILAVGAIVSSAPTIVRAHGAVRATTLTTAWAWSFAALVLWGAATIAALIPGLDEAQADQLWYAVSIVSLCPLIAVLGAKRPGSRVWNWFVLLPLLFVLGMPAFTSWNSSFEVSPLHLEGPWLLGHGLVIVMGFGNYLGTRFTLATLLAAAALALLLIPAGFSMGEPKLLRSIATLVTSGEVCTAGAAARLPSEGAGFDRVWNDFRDHLGIVWARRVQDRLNDTARKENWPARLELHGFRWNEQVEPDQKAKADAQIERALRWILRRFVDPEWIDRRLGKDSGVG